MPRNVSRPVECLITRGIGTGKVSSMSLNMFTDTVISICPHLEQSSRSGRETYRSSCFRENCFWQTSQDVRSEYLVRRFRASVSAVNALLSGSSNSKSVVTFATGISCCEPDECCLDVEPGADVSAMRVEPLLLLCSAIGSG